MSNDNDMNGDPAAPAPVIVPAGEGPVLEAFGDSLQVKLAAEHTRGTLAVGLYTTPPVGGPRRTCTATRTSCS